MPLRRKTVAPQTENAVLAERVSKLEKELRTIRQAGPTTIQTVDTAKYLDPAQGEVFLNWPGTHKTAEPTDPIQYLHDGALKGIGGATPQVWAFCSTENSGWESADNSAETEVDYYRIFLSDTAISADFFGFDVETAGGQFGDDRGFLVMKQSGIYTFTQQLLTSDLIDETDWTYQTRLACITGNAIGNFGAIAGVTGAFPGQIGTIPYIQNREQFRISEAGGDDVWLTHSWTLPIRHPSPGNGRHCARMRMFHTTPSAFWTIRVWVTRNGDLDWDGDAFSGANATWSV